MNQIGMQMIARDWIIDDEILVISSGLHFSYISKIWETAKNRW